MQHLPALDRLLRSKRHVRTPWQRTDLVPGQPLHLAHRTNAEWFNTARFTPAIAHYGSAPRNPVTGVKNDPLTLAVKRVFPLPFEGQHLDFRFEAFNALNHPQFAAPGVVQGSSTFGVITGTHTRQPRSAAGLEIRLLGRPRTETQR